LNIEWISVSPGKVFIGSDNRSILFGGVGPRHEVKIDYDYEISYLPIDIKIAQEIIQSEDVSLPQNQNGHLQWRIN